MGIWLTDNTRTGWDYQWDIYELIWVDIWVRHRWISSKSKRLRASLFNDIISHWVGFSEMTAENDMVFSGCLALRTSGWPQVCTSVAEIADLKLQQTWYFCWNMLHEILPSWFQFNCTTRILWHISLRVITPSPTSHHYWAWCSIEMPDFTNYYRSSQVILRGKSRTCSFSLCTVDDLPIEHTYIIYSLYYVYSI